MLFAFQGSGLRSAPLAGSISTPTEIWTKAALTARAPHLDDPGSWRHSLGTTGSPLSVGPASREPCLSLAPRLFRLQLSREPSPSWCRLRLVPGWALAARGASRPLFMRLPSSQHRRFTWPAHLNLADGDLADMSSSCQHEIRSKPDRRSRTLIVCPRRGHASDWTPTPFRSPSPFLGFSLAEDSIVIPSVLASWCFASLGDCR